MQSELAGRPMEQIAMDILGPFTSLMEREINT